MKSLSSGVVPSSVANAGLRGVTLLSKFVLVIVLARFFPPEELGVYGLMVSSVAIAIFLLGLEYHYFTIRALIARRPGRQAAILRDQAVLYALVAAVTLPLLAVAFSSGLWSPVPRSVLMWFFALVLAELAAQEAGIALIALSRPLAANLVVFVRSGLWVYPIVALAIWQPGARAIQNVFAAWLAGAVASLVVAAWWLRGLGWRAALADSVDWAGMRSGLRTAAPFVITTGASMGLLFLDRFIIEAFKGLGPVGVYTFFGGITTALHTLVNTGVSLIRMPRLVKAHQDGDEPRFRLELGTMARITAGSAVFLAAMIAVAITPILRLVDKSVYEENLGVFFLLLGAALIRCLADLPIYALYAKHRDLQLLVVNLLAVSVSTAVNLLLVPSLGLSGAGIAALAGAMTLLLSALAFRLRGSERSGAAEVDTEALPDPLPL
jgi:O-antigen/teichoic acid export membrane protein